MVPCGDTHTQTHLQSRSRARSGAQGVPREELAKIPPVVHPFVRTHPDGRRSLYMGGHASHIEGVPPEEGRELLEAVTEFATQNRFVYRHVWEADDLVVWDNRSTLHRLQPYDIATERRVMRRITVAGTAAP